MRRTFLVAILVLLPGRFSMRAEIVDRIVAVVDGRVIAWSAALAEANYQAFRKGGEPVETLGVEALGKIVSEMIDQMLLERERSNSPFAVPANGNAEHGAPDGDAEELRKRFSDAEAYRNALRRYKLSEPEVLKRVSRENAILAFVDSHLRPQVRVAPEKVEEYYREKLLPELRKAGGAPAPPLSEVNARIERILAEEEMNRLLDEWLTQLRSHAQITTMFELKSESKQGSMPDSKPDSK